MTIAPHHLTRRDVAIGALALGLSTVPQGHGAFAQAAAPADPVDVEAARREGKVTVYTSAPIAAAQKVGALFEARYGIKVELFRSGGTEILRRFMMEQSANRRVADVLVSSDPAAVMDLAAKGLFTPFRPAGHDKVPAGINDPAGNFVAQRVGIIANYLRADLVPEAERPRTWADLATPRFKGRLVMTDPAFTSLQLGTTAMLSKILGWKFYEGLQANDTLIVKGNEQALQMVKRGERQIAVAADSQYANEARLQGHDVVCVYPAEGTFAIPAVHAVVKGCDNPNAARLISAFFMTDEVQGLWPQSGIYASRADIAPPAGAPGIADIKLMPMDYAYVQAQTGAVKKRFGEIFG